ncbi:MAG: hypothetical protein LC799_23975, partial [Actinobacteria bacterium]|nr:hypothetical protein [Actinomycetota bacterium]
TGTDTMTSFTVADAQAAAERLTAEHQAIFDSLNKLEDHPGRTHLKSAVLHGVTREHSVEVQYGLETLWTLYQTYRSVVLRLRAIQARRSQSTSADLREIEELVSSATTVTLPSPDGSLQPRRRLTLTELVAEFRTAYAGICDVVSAVDEVQTALNLRLDRCHELLRRAGAGAGAAARSLATGPDPVNSTLSQLTEQLDVIRQIAQTDPLRLWAHGGVDLVEVEALTRRCEQAHVAFCALGEQRERAELRGRLSAYRAKAAALGRIDDPALEQRYQRARDLLWAAPCDLALTSTAVAEYQKAVNTTPVGRSRP